MAGEKNPKSKPRRAELEKQRIAELPYLVKIGSILGKADIIEYLQQIIITPDHLIVLSEILLNHMWHEVSEGSPNKERITIVKDLQFDINLLFEISLAAKVLDATRK